MSARWPGHARASATPSPAIARRRSAPSTIVELVEYVTSLPIDGRPPARAGCRCPAAARPSAVGGRRPAAVDRFLGQPDVVHGTNYVVPPSRLPARRVGVRLLVPAPPDAGATPTCAAPGGCCAGRSPRARRCTPARRRPRPRSPSCFPDARSRTIPLGRAAGARRPPAEPPVAGLGRPARSSLALGTLERRKNLPTLVAAFGRLAAEHRDILLVLAGADGDDRPSDRRGDRPRSTRPRPRGSCSTGRVDDGEQIVAAAPRHACSPTRRSTRASASRCSRRCSSACRSSPATAAASPRSAGPAALLVDADDVDGAGRQPRRRAAFDERRRARLLAARPTRSWRTFSWARVRRPSSAALYRPPGRRAHAR